jgi:hypothetical protein
MTKKNDFIQFTYHNESLIKKILIKNEHKNKLLSLSYFKQFYKKFKNTLSTFYQNKLIFKKINIQKQQYHSKTDNINVSNFMTKEVIEETKKLKFQYTFTFLQNKIYFNTNKKLPFTFTTIPLKNKHIKQIIDILFLMETLKIIFGRESFEQVITIFDLNSKKNLPTKYRSKNQHNKSSSFSEINTIIGPNQCNSGLTELDNHKNGPITIYRQEELIKVCIHELFHSNLIDLDFIISSISKNFEKEYCFHYPVLLNEAYTECLALIINTMYIGIMLDKTESYINQMYEKEVKYSIYNVSKILDYYQIHTVQEIKKNNNGHCLKYFNQTTNVYSYYFLKMILLLNLKKLHQIIRMYTLPNTFKLSDKSLPMINDVYQLLNDQMMIIDKYRLPKQKYNKSLRLTLFELHK